MIVQNRQQKCFDHDSLGYTTICKACQNNPNMEVMGTAGRTAGQMAGQSAGQTAPAGGQPQPPLPSSVPRGGLVEIVEHSTQLNQIQCFRSEPKRRAF